ncbi:Cys-tRNA(Pro) deacylase [Sphingomonas sp. CGMCC 1.13654]|uniref:Cys-tRNA(Pro)/Cys-tRNA(Cys) deacylase n=1 Tax=Sphingomonas chungangi TaxID=2683589 RepID=A0A838L9G6_9SPHN|nr:Cys-tRNA(Pro) deacylase [Sphingomonas chungangi]MBA2936083.1 Cys-tRNA(Pro) deacylase [Sphingomonas chungangi]MVW55471.1 Cys-tRNA(Pro) deacylase [Sphingomonas chungangi]
MAKGTPATVAAAKAGISFDLVEYVYDPDADSVGVAAAEALGEPPSRVFKTLLIEADGKPVCAVLPSDREVSMKRIAAAADAKSAKMMPVSSAERLTGYNVGGISPFGQRKAVPIFVEAAATEEAYLFVNGGRRGLQMRLAPEDLVRGLGAIIADFSA